MSLSVPAGDLNSLLPDEDGRRLYIGMKDHLLSTSLDDITQTPRKVCTHPNTGSHVFLIFLSKGNSVNSERQSLVAIHFHYMEKSKLRVVNNKNLREIV